MNKKTIWVIIAVVVIAGGGLWAYKAGVFSNIIQKKDNATIGTISYQGVDGKSALDLLKAKHSVQTQTFSTGELVKTIDGVSPNVSQYWSFMVNGKPSTVGASQYVTHNGDTIEWKLQQINSNL